MWLFYVDECGDDNMATADESAVRPALKPGVSDWFVLSAVGIPSHCRLTLAEELRRLKDRHFPGWRNRDWADTEIKGRHLRQASVRLAAGKPALRPIGYKQLGAEDIRSLCEDLGWVLRKYRPIVYAVAIDKAAMLAKRSDHAPVGVAYAYLQQRLALLVEQGISARGHFTRRGKLCRMASTRSPSSTCSWTSPYG